LKNLLKSGAIQVGTYNYMFSERDPNSPFPFDFEIKFNKGGFPFLLKAYKRWVDKTGTSFIDNPFFSKK